MKTIIRNETPADFRVVEELTRESFWNVYKPGADEHYYVHMMRSHPDFLPELAFVLEKDGEIIGNIMYTKAWLEDENGERKEYKGLDITAILVQIKAGAAGEGKVRHPADPGHLGADRNIGAVGSKAQSATGTAGAEGSYPFADGLCRRQGHSAVASILVHQAMQ